VEPGAGKNVVLQHKEHDDMATERDDSRNDNERERPRALRPSKTPSEPILPPLINEGPEMIRSSHC
jgi:hypothetical protein